MAQTSRATKTRSAPASEGDDNRQTDAFLQQVNAALDHCQDYKWLGDHSPLAAPYLLGSRLDAPTAATRAASAETRGAALYKALQEAASQMQEEELRALVQDRYLKRNPHLSNTGHALRRSISERTFYRLRNRAIAALAAQLYTLLVPPLRLEAPISAPLAGRRAARAALAEALRAGSATYISGASGVGKSTLASHTAHQFEQAQARFWFTVRPGLNDHLTSLVFALAYFLHERGAPHTWRQLIADGGRVGEERALALLRYDFSLLQEPVLLCIDDVDALRPEITEHGRLLYLLEGLPEIVHDRATLLLIGQRVVLHTPVQIALHGFDEEELREWLAQNHLHLLDDAQMRELARVTQGSPLLLTLFATLLRSGEEPDALLATFAGAPALEALLMRIWRRLDAAERTLLMRLAVFAEAAPADAWQAETQRIVNLAERGLLTQNATGELLLPSHLRPLIYDHIPADLQRAYHAEASLLLEQRGEVVRAMHHTVAAHAPERALLLWLAHRHQQINRGNGTRALAILSSIAASDLPTAELATALQAVRAELLMLAGDAEQAEAGLRRTASTGDARMDAYTNELLATTLEAQGQGAHAARLYNEALEMLLRPAELSRIRIHNRLVALHTSTQRDLGAAREHAWSARMEAEMYQGSVEEAAGNLEAARACYENARTLASQFNCAPATLTTLYSHLGRLLMLLGNEQEGIAFMQQAIHQDTARGNLRRALMNRINVAWAMTMAEQTSEALAFALEGLSAALRMKNGYLIAGLAAAAGEAAVALGQEEDAEGYLNVSLQQEEEFFRPWALTALGALRTRQQRPVEALRLLEHALAESRAIEDQHGEAYALHALAQTERATGNLEAARAAIQRAHTLYTELGMRRASEATATLLAELTTSAITESK